jgi:hypothetical protein
MKAPSPERNFVNLNRNAALLQPRDVNHNGRACHTLDLAERRGVL